MYRSLFAGVAAFAVTALLIVGQFATTGAFA